MKIVLLHYTIPPVVGGVERVIFHHARLMAADGHSIRLIAGRGRAVSEDIPMIHVPLADSRHERVAHVKAQLDLGEVTQDFELLHQELVEP
ncbi:MAG: glycosyltransferase family 4 protein, partial [Chloroflexi bacterium]|nr:glycosyltransferase family 4 protein [Chloroflexota bacterium]